VLGNNLKTGVRLLLCSLVLIGTSYTAFAQPANDNCANAVTLTPGDPCISGTTVGASTETGELGGCNTGNQSVWYSFVADNDSMDVTVGWESSTGCYFGSAVWDPLVSGCPATAGAPLACEDAPGGPLTNYFQLTGLTIGNTYYIQVVYDPGGVCGNAGAGANFCIEVEGPTWLGNDL